MTAKLLFPAPVCNPENFSILHKHDILPTKIAGLRSCDVTGMAWTSKLFIWAY